MDPLSLHKSASGGLCESNSRLVTCGTKAAIWFPKSCNIKSQAAHPVLKEKPINHFTGSQVVQTSFSHLISPTHKHNPAPHPPLARSLHHVEVLDGSYVF